MLKMFRSVWLYRGFVVGSVRREFQSRYRNSLLGAVWTILQPLAMILVYTLIFSQIMQAKLPGVDNSFGYSIYLCAGVLTWGLFSEISARSQNMFLDNANLIKKLSFPRLCLPISVVATALLNFCIIFSLFTGFLLLSGNFPGLAYVALAPILLLVMMFAAGLGILLGVLNVFFRDVGQFFSIFITFWFWLTPIVYPSSILPEGLQVVIAFNPMVNIMAAIQGVLVLGEWPLWRSLTYPLVLSIVLCILGLSIYRKRVGEMVDEL